MSDSSGTGAVGRSFRLGRREALDGLRAVAVALVFWHHLRILVPGGLAGPDAGYLGVDIFFVLSGFLITSLLLQEHDDTGQVSLRGFWRRRILRLVPAVTAFLAVHLVVTALMRDSVRGQLGFVTAALTSTFNWVVVATGAERAGVLAPLWSLSIEEQFYLVWPPVVAACLVRCSRGHDRLLRIAAGGVLAVTIWRGLLVAWRGVDRAYFHTDARVDAVLVGAVLALAVHRWGLPIGRRATAVRAAGWVAVVALTWLIAVTELTATSLVAGSPVVAVATAVVLVALLDPVWRVSRALAWQPLQWIGKRSYALYLWHSLVIVLAMWGLPDAGRATTVTIALAASLAIAEASWRWVEGPFRALRPVASERAVRVGPAEPTAAIRWRPEPRARRALATATAAIAVFALAAVGPAYAARDGRDRQAELIAAASHSEEAPAGADSGGTATSDGAPAGVPDGSSSARSVTAGRRPSPGGAVEVPAPVAGLVLSISTPEAEVADVAGSSSLVLRASVSSTSGPVSGVGVVLAVGSSSCSATTRADGLGECRVVVGPRTSGEIIVEGAIDGSTAPPVRATFRLEIPVTPPATSLAGGGL